MPGSDRSVEIRRALGVSSEFDPEAEIRTRVGFLKEYSRAAGRGALWLAVSGGVDSALCGRLCALAVAERNAEEGAGAAKFVAVRLPHDIQHDEEDARRALAWIRPTETATVNIAPAVRALEASLPKDRLAGSGPDALDFARGNTKARMRMVAQYHLAHLDRGLVVGTDHGAEAVVGFFTKFGDGAVDAAPLFGLTKRRVVALARHLGAPARTLAKIPTADLQDLRPGLPDEEELGLAYREIDDYLEGLPISDSVARRIEEMYLATEHKRRPPVTPGDRWWRSGAWRRGSR